MEVETRLGLRWGAGREGQATAVQNLNRTPTADCIARGIGPTCATRLRRSVSLSSDTEHEYVFDP